MCLRWKSGLKKLKLFKNCSLRFLMCFLIILFGIAVAKISETTGIKTSQNFNITFRVFSGKCTSIVGSLKPFCSFFVSLISFFKRYITERRKQCFNASICYNTILIFFFFFITIMELHWFERGFGLSHQYLPNIYFFLSSSLRRVADCGRDVLSYLVNTFTIFFCFFSL
jgi:hypothetical protein